MNEAEFAHVTVPTFTFCRVKGEKKSQSFIVSGELKLTMVFGLHVLRLRFSLYPYSMFVLPKLLVKCKKKLQISSLENYMTFGVCEVSFFVLYFWRCVYINLFVPKIT